MADVDEDLSRLEGGSSTSLSFNSIPAEAEAEELKEWEVVEANRWDVGGDCKIGVVGVVNALSPYLRQMFRCDELDVNEIGVIVARELFEADDDDNNGVVVNSGDTAGSSEESETDRSNPRAPALGFLRYTSKQ
jgi:hypothetical protein